ncbi:MAG: enoyl-CoA hydratase/isomerase family protein [Acidobacteriota bacterium]
MKASAPKESWKPLDSRNLMSAPTEYRCIRYEEKEDVVYVTLNRPEIVNCLSTEMSDEMVHAFARIRKSSTLKIVVIKGAGNNFCSGDDLKEMANGVWGNTHQYFERVRYYQQMAYDLEELDKVTIAAIDGYAVGGGLEITMCCDFAIATQRAKWGMPEVDWGITPGWGGTTRMARLIGRRLTKEINMLAAIHPAKKAVQVGLWNRVVPNGQLDEEVDKLIALIRAKSQQTLRQLKYIINKGVECDLYTSQAFEALSAAWTASVNGWWQVPDADQGKGLAAFRDKTALQKQRRGLGSGFWVDK